MIWIILLMTPVLTVSLLGYWVVSRVQREASLFREDTLRKLADSSRLNAYQAEGYARLLMMVSAATPEKRAAYYAEGTQFRDKVDLLLKDYTGSITPDQTEARRDFESFVEKRKRYREISLQVRQLLEANQHDAARDLVDSSLIAAYQQYTVAGDVLFERDMATGQQRAREIESLCAKTQLFTVGICVIAFLIGVLTPVILMLIEGSSAREPVFS